MQGKLVTAVLPEGTWVPIKVEPKAAVAAACRRVCVLLTGCLLLLVALPSPAGAARAASRAPLASANAPPSRRVAAPFTHITIEEGLSDQRVQTVAQDRAGFLWFGTNDGLNRYDGYDIVTYRHDPANPYSLSGNHIADLYVDRAGTLWVGTWSGLNAFDRRTERFIRYQHDPADRRSLSHDTVMAIDEDRSGVLWIGTASGLNRLDRATGTFTVYRHDPAKPRSLSHDIVRVIREDRSGTLWIGTHAGLNRFDRATGTFTVYRHDPTDPRSLSHNNVWEICEDRAGRLWVGTDGGGLSRFNRATGAFTHYRHDSNCPNSLSADRVDCIAEDVSGRLWIGTFGGGVSVFDVARSSFTSYRHDPDVPTTLSNNNVAEIFSDRSGLLWFATQGGGVDLHNPPPPAISIYRHDPKAPHSLASNLVRAVYEGRDGRLWIGTEDCGLDCLDRRSGQVVHYPPDPENPHRLGHPMVSAIEQDRKGALWVGTFGGGLYRRDPAGGRFTAYRHDPGNPRSLSSNAVTDLCLDRSGVLWVGTMNDGLNRFDPASGVFTRYRHDPSNPRSLGSDTVYALAVDSHGSLWIGTWDGGLNRLDPATGRITQYRHDPRNPASLGSNDVWALHFDRSGILWVGTFNSGLDRFDPARGVFSHYGKRDGLASDRIISIVEDGHDGDPGAGNLWIATGRGLSRLDRDRKTFHTYDTSDGLPVTEYNRGGCMTRSGELLMSTLRGLMAFDPDAVRDDAQAPPVVFTRFLLANKPIAIGERSPLPQAIDLTDAVELSYADRVVSFEFAALSFRAPRQNRYRYRLEGFDNDWIEVDGTRRLVTYTNLDPSRYIFRVTAADANGAWNPTGRAIALVITPPWWATWWFRGLALALIVGSAAGLYTWRVNSLHRQRRALEAEIVERQQVEAALRASHRQIQDLAGRLITAQEVERTRIARELHDDINQQLAALAIAHSSLKRRLRSEDAEAQAEVARLQQQTIALSEEIRHLSHELHPGVLQHAGLVAALRGRCDEFGRQLEIAVTFRAEGDLDGLPEAVSLCLFRVAQEALHNIAAHAAARQVEVALTRGAAGLELTVRDDGRGFDPAAARRGGGLGLISIDERVRLLDGSVTIDTQPHQGTALRVLVPLGPPSAPPSEPQGPPQPLGSGSHQS